MSREKVIYNRNPIYIFVALAALVVFGLTAILASRSNIGPLEQAMFDVLYRLPEFLTPIFIGITMLGSFVAVLLLALVFVFKKRLDVALRLLAAAGMARLIVELVKNWIERGRPEIFFPWINERIYATGFGFPSGHAATSAALGMTLALYIPRAYRKWIIWGFVLIGLSRIYLGVHLPYDVIGGWAVGIFSYSLTSLIFGSRFSPVDPTKLAQKLDAQGLKSATLKPASVDARGSVPFFGSYEGGKIFVKVFNQDNNAADWLFKLIRRVRYRRLEDEVPSLTPKRTIEHEAYLTMLAISKAKVRAPEFLGVFKVGTNSYAMALKRIDAEGLDKISSKKVSDKLLAETWSQIKRLHENRIIHKDLRTANVMVEKSTNLPWIIDFGFSEAAINHKSFYKDNVEFISSSATKIGAKKAVEAAYKALGATELGEALPYMQYAALSGATTTALKQQRGLLEEIRQEMQRAAALDKSAAKKARISRLKLKR